MESSRVLLSPSMMCADFLNLKEELDALKAKKVDTLHIDVMDGNYVPNFTLGPDIAFKMHQYSGIPLDFHLMVENVDDTIPVFTKYGGSTITFHPETSRHPIRVIESIKNSHCKAGIAIDPGMSLETLKYILPSVDIVCVMTVNPGFAGQKLLVPCLGKVAELQRWRDENNWRFLIQVDGNVSWDNIPKMIGAGANILVLGTSSIFNTSSTRLKSFQRLHRLLEEVAMNTKN